LKQSLQEKEVLLTMKVYR